jgi:cytochrome oxidase Cu insertion factor (SCO1/SenC/PrrC family)
MRITVAAAALSLAGCSLRSSLPVFGSVPDFQLTRETGQSFAGADTAGLVWVANFMFTKCAGPCPRMAAQMKQVQTKLEGVQNVLLLSFTIDPENDTPAALEQYARRFGADKARWRFLTGDEAELQKLARTTFFLADVGPPYEHSTKFALVDRRGRIRGYYDSTDRNAMDDLVSHVGELLREKL